MQSPVSRLNVDVCDGGRCRNRHCLLVYTLGPVAAPSVRVDLEADHERHREEPAEQRLMGRSWQGYAGTDSPQDQVGGLDEWRWLYNSDRPVLLVLPIHVMRVRVRGCV